MSEAYREKNQARQSADWMLDDDGSPMGLIGPDGRLYQLSAAIELSGGGHRLVPASALPGPYKSRNPGNSLTRAFYGRFSAYPTGGNDHTTHLQCATESPFKAIRFHMFNPVPADITGVRLKFSVNSGEAGAAASNQARAPSGGTWLSAQVNGADTWTMQAGVDENNISVTSTDIYVVDSATRSDSTGFENPLVWLRGLVPAVNANRPGFYNYGVNSGADWQAESSCAGRIWRPLTQAVDGVTSQLSNLNTSSVIDYTCMPIAIETFVEVPALNVAVFGNSNFDKAGHPSRIGWQDDIKHALSSAKQPVEFATFAVGGSDSDDCYARMARVLGTQRFDFAVFPGLNVNDLFQPITAANIEKSLANLRRCMDLCSQYGVRPIVATATPANTTGSVAKVYGASDALRRFGNDLVRKTADAVLVDHAKATEGGENDAGQVEFIPGYSGDGAHLDAPGRAAVVAADTDVYRALVSVNL